ncbi:MAG: WD40/YVTN/BNR-like repeat-containing protein [Bacteroidota bacterium]
MTKIRFAALPLLLFPMLISVLQARAQGDDVRSEFSSNTANAKKRFDWFYQKRAFPNDTLEQGYLLRGLQKIQDYAADRSVELTWQNIGPQPGTYFNYGNIGGRIPALAVHPTDPSIVYIGPADGGVWKTTNGGTNWQAQTDFLASLASGSLAIDSNSPETVYWATGEPYYSGDAYGGAGVFQSTNGGATWTSIGLTGEKRIPKIVVDPNDGNKLFAATWGGIYRTTNKGGTWTKTLNLGYGYDIVIHPTNSSILYCGVGDNSSSAGIYHSTDNGVSWTKLTNGLPASSSINRLKIDIARSSPSTVYALMSSRSPFGGMLGIYKSTDGGATWTVLSAAPSNLFGNQGWYDIELGVSPTDANLVFAGGVNIYRTTDGGAAWSNVSGSNVHVDQHSIGFGAGVVYIGSDGGVWKSTNNGSTWTNLNSSLAVTQFYSVGTDKLTPARIYGGTQDNGTQRTTGSLGWTGVLGGDGGMIVVDHSNSNIVYGETQNGNIYKSTNGGTSFSFIYAANGAWVTPLRLDPTNASVVFTANARVMRSTNGGSSWSAISDSLNGATQMQWLTIHPTDSEKIYAASSDKVFTTSNGGVVWTNISTGLPSRYIEQIVLDPNMPTTVYLALSGTGTGHVYKSTNGGSSWSNISGDLPDVPANALLVPPGLSTTLYLGTDLGLFVSSNGGNTWVKETGLPNVAVINLALTSDSYLIAATHGRSMFKSLLAAQPSVTVVVPNGGEEWLAGSSSTVQWNSSSLSGNVKIELSRDGGSTFSEVLSASTSNDGVQEWVVSGTPTTTAKIRVSSVSTPTVADTSNASFEITQAAIVTTSPAPASIWMVGGSVPVQWNSAHLTGNVKIELSRDGGMTFPEILFAGTENDGVETWTASGTQTSLARIRISSITQPSVVDTTPGTFTISTGFDFLTFVVLEDNGLAPDTLWLGTASGATVGIDGVFGEMELPPRPPMGVFDIRWSIPGTQGSYRDVRPTISPDQLSVVFTALFQEGSEGYPFRIRWNPAAFPDGQFIIRDQVTGGLLFNVDMKLTDSISITNPAIETFEIVHSDFDTVAITTVNGWNMVSLPVTVANPRAVSVFPDAVSNAFTFTNQGYISRDTIEYGAGYWMKFESWGTSIIGGARTLDTVKVKAGWNMIGSISSPVPVDSIIQIPAGIVQSQFVGQGGPTTTIEPGRSYWVKVLMPGKLVLRATDLPSPNTLQPHKQ